MIHIIALALMAFLAGFLFGRVTYKNVQIESWQVYVTSDRKLKTEIFATENSITVQIKTELDENQETS